MLLKQLAARLQLLKGLHLQRDQPVTQHETKCLNSTQIYYIIYKPPFFLYQNIIFSIARHLFAQHSETSLNFSKDDNAMIS